MGYAPKHLAWCFDYDASRVPSQVAMVQHSPGIPGKMEGFYACSHTHVGTYYSLFQSLPHLLEKFIDLLNLVPFSGHNEPTHIP